MSFCEIVFKVIKWICFGLRRLVLTFKLKCTTNSLLRFMFSKELEVVTSMGRLARSCSNFPWFRSCEFFMMSKYFFIFHVLFFSLS